MTATQRPKTPTISLTLLVRNSHVNSRLNSLNFSTLSNKGDKERFSCVGAEQRIVFSFSSPTNLNFNAWSDKIAFPPAFIVYFMFGCSLNSTPHKLIGFLTSLFVACPQNNTKLSKEWETTMRNKINGQEYVIPQHIHLEHPHTVFLTYPFCASFLS